MKSLFFHMEGYLNSLKQERDLIQKKTLLSSLFQRNKKIISKKRNSNFQVRKKKKKFPRTREWNEVEFSSPFPVSKGVHSLLWRERNWR